MRFAVIMAGGTGTRFWPESREKKPKQFLNLVGNRTMLQTTIDRIKKLIDIDRVLVVTNSSYTGLVKEQIPELPDENIIGEPIGRNTAPCVAAATAIILNRNSSASMVVLPSDHYIRNEERFLQVIEAGFEKAEKDHCLITIGIQPHRPETGYGYIQINEGRKSSIKDETVYQVKTFAEKPDLNTAVHFLESGDFLWNSGMFIWRAVDIQNQFEVYLPQICSEANRLQVEIQKDAIKAIDNFYNRVASISIDYGIMEKTDAVYVIPAEFGWNDVGSWMAIYELEEKNDKGNVIRKGNALFEKSQNCFVSSVSGKLITMVSLQGVGLVETEDAILICRMERAQDVRDVTKRLDSPKLKKYK